MDESRKRRTPLVPAFIGCAALIGVGLAGHASDRGQGIELRKTVISGGGTVLSQGSGFILAGTVGQPDAAGVVMTGDVFALRAGFWPAGSVGGGSVFSDGFETGDLSRWSP